MVSSMRTLLNSFRGGVARRRRRALAWLLGLYAAIKLVVLVALIIILWPLVAALPGGLSGGALPNGAQEAISSALNTMILLQLLEFGAVMASFGSIGAISSGESVPAYARTLMRVVEARDTSVAPTVTVSRAEAPTRTEATLGPISHPLRLLDVSPGAYLAGALASVLMIGFSGFMLAISLRATPTYALPTTPAGWRSLLSFPITLLLMSLGWLLWTLVGRHFARVERQGLLAQVDADSVTFHQATSAGRVSDERRMRWSEARGFARLLCKDSRGRLHEIFALSASDGEDFLWEALYVHPDDTAYTTSEAEARNLAAHQLVEVVTERAELPLLDLTPAIATTLTSSYPRTGFSDWRLFSHALAVAQMEGDAALAREIVRRALGARGALAIWVALRAYGARSVRRLTATQREDSLQLARALLPYYPTRAQLTPSVARRLLLRSYLSGELVFQLLLIVFALANIALFATQFR